MQPMRPRFSERVPFTRDEVVARLRARQVCSGCPCRLSILDRHVDVSIAAELQHLWSPHLTLEIHPDPAGSRLEGLYAPNPNVWTSFIAAYGAIGVSAFFGVMLGLSQTVVRETPWGLAALPLGVLLALGVYGASLFGQRLAAEQMEQLACFLRAALGQHAPADPPPCGATQP